MSLTPTSFPLPTFPFDIHHSILAFCDASTLAQTSRVSLAFLERSSPLLYREVSIEGFEKLGKLFCSRHTHQSSLTSHLSLDQIQTFTFKETRQSISPSPVLHRARIGSPTLSVTRLSIFLPPVRSPSSLIHIFDSAQGFIETILLPRFSPGLLYIEGYPASRAGGGRATIPSPTISSLGSFNNLRTLHLKDARCIFISPLLSSPLVDVLFVVEESDGLSDQEQESLLSGTAREFAEGLELEVEENEGVSKTGVRRLEVSVGSDERKQEWLDCIRMYADEVLQPSVAKEKLTRVEVSVRS